MGYLHIPNLYKEQDILLFKKCFAMEKIHGTSAHVSFRDGKILLFPGGAKLEEFEKNFDKDKLLADLTAIFGDTRVVIYGEAYGGKMQGMRKTYGDTLKFVAFDVKVGGIWVNVTNAFDICSKVGLDFVPFAVIDTDMGSINYHRMLSSCQAERCGITEPKKREGIVLRPLIEVTKSNGDRIIAKHKNPEFQERKTQPEVSPERLAVLTDASRIADEWVVPMRLVHVLDKLPSSPTYEQVIRAMLEDVMREAAGEIVDTKEVRKAIGSRTAAMFKKHMESRLNEPAND